MSDHQSTQYSAPRTVIPDASRCMAVNDQMWILATFDWTVWNIVKSRKVASPLTHCSTPHYCALPCRIPSLCDVKGGRKQCQCGTAFRFFISARRMEINALSCIWRTWRRGSFKPFDHSTGIGGASTRQPLNDRNELNCSMVLPE